MAYLYMSHPLALAVSDQLIYVYKWPQHKHLPRSLTTRNIFSGFFKEILQ